ncbi:MAG: potassium transporter KefB [Sphingobacteriales bacterium]|nr:MAG: potassium transporter KefB [Sphingobacteriales bacterium]
MQIPILNEIVIIFGLTIAVLFICHRFKIPTVVGFLISGVLAGPSGFRLVPLSHEVEMLSEIGVVMLLFTIGIEFSLNNLMMIRKYVLLGGTLQVFLTLGATALLSMMFGLTAAEGAFMGFLICLSSTAIALKILQQRDEISSPHGRTALAILIFQDIIVVPMMLVTPILAGQESNLTGAILMLLAKGAGIILFTFVLAQYVMPRLLFQVARMRSQEIFLISIIVICFAIAGFTSSLGLSLSLGAFLAGLIISKSEYSHQALSSVMPFRDIFTSLFFISIGMLLDTDVMLQRPFEIVLITLGILLLKAFFAGSATFFLGYPLRTVILVGLSLSQVGEFSFVLSKVGLDSNLLSQSNYQLFLAVSILTMAISPFLVPISHKLADRAIKWPLPLWLRDGLSRNKKENHSAQPHDELENLDDHIIIIGLGISGKNVAKAAKNANLPYVIVEMNPDTVRREKQRGENIVYGDAIQEGIMHHVQILKARVLVVAIPDASASRGIVSLAHRLNPKLYIIVRTHYMQEMKPLYKLGANEVIPEEFETSIEIFTIVMLKYLVPRAEIDKFIASIRADGYQMFRTQAKPMLGFADFQQHISGIDLSTFVISANSPLVSKSLAELNMRQAFKISLLAIVREGETVTNPESTVDLRAGDKIIVFGAPDDIFIFSQVLFNKMKLPEADPKIS